MIDQEDYQDPGDIEDLREFDEWLESQLRGELEQRAYENGDYTPRREGEL